MHLDLTLGELDAPDYFAEEYISEEPPKPPATVFVKIENTKPLGPLGRAPSAPISSSAVVKREPEETTPFVKTEHLDLNDIPSIEIQVGNVKAALAHRDQKAAHKELSKLQQEVKKLSTRLTEMKCMDLGPQFSPT